MTALIASLVLALVPIQQPAAPPVTVVPVINEAPTKANSYNWMARHNEVVNRVKKGDVDLIMIGDSITHGWNRGLWDQYYAPRKAVNLGFGWDGTQHVLWRLQNGEIDGISPKVAVLLIGVNNIGWCTPEDTAKGTEEIVRTLRTKLPTTKVLILGVFPWKQTPDAPERKKISDLNEKVAALAKSQKDVTFLDFGKVFLEKDGTISKEIMPDYLHLSAKGYRRWFVWMEPTLRKLMGEQ